VSTGEGGWRGRGGGSGVDIFECPTFYGTV